MKKRLLTVVLCLFLVLACACSNNANNQNIPPETPEVTGKFSFDILKIGQADAIIMQTNNHSLMIDCGEKDDGEEIVEFLKNKGIEKLDYLFVTHFDEDHIGGFPEVFDAVTIDKIAVPDYEGTNKEYDTYINILNENNFKTDVITEKTVIELDDVIFEVYPPQKKHYDEGDNDYSLVISTMHGENSFLFAGDAEKDRIDELVKQVGRKHDFLKIPHHGRCNSSTKKLAQVIKPSYAVITCSEKNPPEEQTVEIFESVSDTKLYYTKDGNVSVNSDGVSIQVVQ